MITRTSPHLIEDPEQFIVDVMLELGVVRPWRGLEVVVANFLEGCHIHRLNIRNASISNMLIKVCNELCDQVAF